MLRVEDLDHEGATIFLDNVKPKEALKLAVEASYTWLYTPLTAPKQYVHVHDAPPLPISSKKLSSFVASSVKTITLVLRSFDGVAYTFGTHVDKEIHLSLDYVVGSAPRVKDEIEGVLVHEVVHCYQYNALNTCPGGLIEGIAGLAAGVVDSDRVR